MTTSCRLHASTVAARKSPVNDNLLSLHRNPTPPPVPAGLFNHLNLRLGVGTVPDPFRRRPASAWGASDPRQAPPGGRGVGRWSPTVWRRKSMTATGCGARPSRSAIVAAIASFAPWAPGSVLLSLGTVMVYPTLRPPSATSPTPSGECAPWAPSGPGATAVSRRRTAPSARHLSANPRTTRGRVLVGGAACTTVRDRRRCRRGNRDRAPEGTWTP